jgi:hypothetical protein
MSRSTNSGKHPTRVVLLLQHLQNQPSYVDLVTAFLNHYGKVGSEFDNRRDFVHVASTYFVMDMDHQDFESPRLEDLSHKVYKVFIGEGGTMLVL